MKPFLYLFTALSFLLVGCAEPDEPYTPSKPDIILSLGDAVCDASSVTLTISASGKDLDMFNRWGVTYSESSDKKGGRGLKSTGVPSDGTNEIVINGLKDNTTYYIWGWAYTKSDDQVWTEDHITATTAKKPDPKPAKLSGTVIGSRYSVDYTSGSQSTTVNVKNNVFDGNFDTYFASYDRSGTWVGLDLGSKHVITKIGYSPRITQSHRVELAMIEGANNPDFSDALPIHMIKQSAPERQMTYEQTSCSRGFRYVRYVSPNDVRCNLAELEFYGYEDEGDDSKLYQLTNLPTVVINTEGSQEIVSKEEELSSTVYIISEEGTNLLATTETGVRGRGNASWDQFPKKPYRLKFKSKQSPLGAPASV